MEHICGVYKITNILNKKVYIGSSNNIDYRWYQHKNLLKNNKHHSIKLQNSYNLHGEECFKYEIVEICDKDILLEREQYWIDYYKSYDSEYGYNILNYSTGGSKFKTWEDINDNKTAISASVMKDLLWYLQNTSEPIIKIANILGISNSVVYQIYKKETYTEITKDIVFVERKIRGPTSLTEETVLNIAKRIIDGVHPSDISKEFGVSKNIIGDIRRKKTWKDVTSCIDFSNVKIHKAKTDNRAKTHKGKAIVQYDFYGNVIREYESIKDAERVTGINKNQITKVVKGKKVQSGGYIWRYKGDAFNLFNLEERLTEKVINKAVESRKLGINIDCRQKVAQYDIDGVLIDSFESISEAERITGIPSTVICAVANGRKIQSSGYVWRHYDEPFESFDINKKLTEEKKNKIRLSNKKIYQYDLDGGLLNIFNSISDAVRNTNISRNKIKLGLDTGCVGEEGYVWKYV